MRRPTLAAEFESYSRWRNQLAGSIMAYRQ